MLFRCVFSFSNPPPLSRDKEGKEKDHQRCACWNQMIPSLLLADTGVARATTFFFFSSFRFTKEKNLARTNEIPDRLLINKPTPKRQQTNKKKTHAIRFFFSLCVLKRKKEKTDGIGKEKREKNVVTWLPRWNHSPLASWLISIRSSPRVDSFYIHMKKRNDRKSMHSFSFLPFH